MFENCFRNMNCFFLDQANSSFDPSQILIYYDFPYPELPLLSHHLCQVLPDQVLYWFPHFVLPHLTTCHHKYWIYQIICQVEPIKFIIKPYTDCSTLQVKQCTHQKAESLRAASFIFTTTCAYNHSYNFHQKFVPLLNVKGQGARESCEG